MQRSNDSYIGARTCRERELSSCWVLATFQIDMFSGAWKDGRLLCYNPLQTKQPSFLLYIAFYRYCNVRHAFAKHPDSAISMPNLDRHSDTILESLTASENEHTVFKGFTYTKFH